MPAVETEAATTTEETWAKLKTGLLKCQVSCSWPQHSESQIGNLSPSLALYQLSHFEK